ncbi:hypothetical protein ACOSP7_010886 [Xanthoceras sorbifolium]
MYSFWHLVFKVVRFFSLCNFMESESPTVSASLNSESFSHSIIKDRDFLNHLEAHLAKRGGVDKLLKISNCATKILLAFSVLPETATLTHQLKRFASHSFKTSML